VRRPRVAGTRKPATDSPSAPQRMPSPNPRPRPEPAAFEDEAPTAVFEAVVAEPEVDEPVAEPDPIAEPEPSYEPSDDVFEAAPGNTASGEISGELKPSPRRKLRDTGIHKPVDVEAAEAEVADAPARAKAKTGLSPYVRAGALIVVGLLLAGAAVFFKVKDNEISSATSNTALLDVAKTAQVKDQVSKAAETLFSYDFNNIAKTENAAKDLLVGDQVRAKYDSLMGEVKRLAPAQKMVVTSRVTRSGVIMLNGDLAKVMVFIDQTSTRTDTKQTAAGSAQLHLNAELQGNTWKITDMDTYVAPSAPPAPAAPSSAAAPSK
jgi:Mce-associated membrane protein